MSASFKRLKNGKWGLLVNGPIKVGDKVEVEKKDGTIADVRIKDIIWQDDDQDVAICTIDRSNRRMRMRLRLPDEVVAVIAFVGWLMAAWIIGVTIAFAFTGCSVEDIDETPPEWCEYAAFVEHRCQQQTNDAGIRYPVCRDHVICGSCPIDDGRQGCVLGGMYHECVSEEMCDE